MPSVDAISSTLALRRRFTEPNRRSNKIFPVLTHARAIVENAFFDSFFHEQLVICVGKPMRLVANALKQTQGRGIHWKSQRQRTAGSINLLEFFCQADDRQVVQAQSLQFAAGR